MSVQNQKPATPRALLGMFMPAALVVIALIILNLLQPSLLNGDLSTIFNVVFWIALLLALLSLIGLVLHFLRQLAGSGLSFMERLTLGILIPSFVIVSVMSALAAMNPNGLLADARNVAINQLFWGMVAIMSLSFISFIALRFSSSSRRRKKKSRMYYY